MSRRGIAIAAVVVLAALLGVGAYLGTADGTEGDPPVVAGWTAESEQYCRTNPEDNRYFWLKNRVEACHCASKLLAEQFPTKAEYDALPLSTRQRLSAERFARCSG